MEPAPPTRPSLLIRLAEPRDEVAWAEFVAIYGPFVRDLARRKGLQPADAADLEQEVFRSVAAAIERWDPDPARGSFRGWLFRIARNRMVNFLIARDRHPRGSGDTAVADRLAAVPAAEPAWIEAESRRHLFRWAAERVRPRCREATWLAFWRTAVEGRPAAEVAAELGLTPGAVHVHRSRVIARLREAIDRVEGTDDTPATAGDTDVL